MSINYKIKSARFYQAVILNEAMCTYIINPEYVIGRVEDKKNVKLSLSDNGLEVESQNEVTIVSWNNIASVTLDKNAPLPSPAEAKRIENSKTSDDVAASIKSKKSDIDWKKI